MSERGESAGARGEFGGAAHHSSRTLDSRIMSLSASVDEVVSSRNCAAMCVASCCCCIAIDCSMPCWIDVAMPRTCSEVSRCEAAVASARLRTVSFVAPIVDSSDARDSVAAAADSVAMRSMDSLVDAAVAAASRAMCSSDSDRRACCASMPA